VTVSSIGGGIGVIGGQGAYVTIDAPNVYRYSTAGTPIRKEMHLVSFNASGKDYQLGAGASAVAGTLVLVAE